MDTGATDGPPPEGTTMSDREMRDLGISEEAIEALKAIRQVAVDTTIIAANARLHTLTIGEVTK